MKDFLADRARTSPDRPALIFRENTWTYAELNTAVAGMSARLDSWGLRAGDRTAVFLPNRPELVILVHALARLGAVIVPLNLRLTRFELADLLAQADVKWLLVGEEAETVRGLLPAERTIVIETLQSGVVDSSGWAHREIALEREWGILFTSGTSGRAKGAVLTYGNLHASAMSSALRLGSHPDDRWLLGMPLYHVGGLSIVFRCALYGTTVVLQDGFEPDALLLALDRYRVTMISLVPTMLRKLLDRFVGVWPESVRLVLLGGAAAREDLVAEAISRGLPVALTYGLTEAASQVATAPPELVRRKVGSVGKPLDTISLRIVNEAGAVQPPGVPGEIQVQGPTVMRGYLGFPELTGWLSTGDIGYLDGEGDLFVMQRRTDLIVTGGENVYPAEVESVLRAHPAVRDVCVVGLPDEVWGQRVAALVVPREKIDAEAIEAFLRTRLAGYKLPRRIVFADELPCTASGKVCRPDVIEVINNAAGNGMPATGIRGVMPGTGHGWINE